MIIGDKMFSVYLCLLLSNIVLSANISVDTYGYWHNILIVSPNQYIDNRFMSFTLNSCSIAYVYLLSGKTDIDSFYIVVIGDRYAKLSKWTPGDLFWTRLTVRWQRERVRYCYVDADFYITWDDHYINIGFGLESNGPLFLTHTSLKSLWSISHIRIRTYKSGEWTLYYTSDTPFTFDEEAVNITSFDEDLIPTDEPRSSQNKPANNLSTLSLGTSIPSQRYTVTEIQTMSVETTEVAETTTTDGMTTTSDDLQSTITNGDTEISDTSAESAATTKTSPLELVTTPSSLSMVGTTNTEPSTSACECKCPKISVKPINNDLIDQLKIDKKTLSSYKRRRKSATDPRKSSFYIGCIGITVLVIYVACIVLLDCIPRA